MDETKTTESTQTETPDVQQQPQETPPTESPEVSADLVRKHPLFQKVTAELSKINTEREAKETEELKQREEFKALYEKALADNESLKGQITEKERALFSTSVRSRLKDAGMDDQLTQDGALAGLPADIEADGVDAWIEELKARNPGSFAPQTKSVNVSSVGDPATGSSAPNIEKMKAMFESSDREERRKAQDFVSDYRKEHNKYPW